MAIRIKFSRDAYDQADADARSLETRIAHFRSEWEARKHIYDEEIRRLDHDQKSLRGVLMCILDELDKADAAAAKKAAT
jgi:hypothetical protein